MLHYSPTPLCLCTCISTMLHQYSITSPTPLCLVHTYLQYSTPRHPLCLCTCISTMLHYSPTPLCLCIHAYLQCSIITSPTPSLYVLYMHIRPLLCLISTMLHYSLAPSVSLYMQGHEYATADELSELRKAEVRELHRYMTCPEI